MGFFGKVSNFSTRNLFQTASGYHEALETTRNHPGTYPEGYLCGFGVLRGLLCLLEVVFLDRYKSAQERYTSVTLFRGFFQEKMPNNSNGSTFPRVSAIFSDFFSDPPLDFWPGTPILVEFLAQNPKNRVCDSPKQRFKQPCKGLGGGACFCCV